MGSFGAGEGMGAPSARLLRARTRRGVVGTGDRRGVVQVRAKTLEERIASGEFTKPRTSIGENVLNAFRDVLKNNESPQSESSPVQSVSPPALKPSTDRRARHVDHDAESFRSRAFVLSLFDAPPPGATTSREDKIAESVSFPRDSPPKPLHLLLRRPRVAAAAREAVAQVAERGDEQDARRRW